jgi:oxalate decarboxylase/phosphoglucose isomerase-like protein (cupin superfamily)
MAKIDLRKSSGIPISYNGADLQPQGLKFKNVSTVNIDEIRPQLLNKSLSCPEIFYKKWLELDGEDIFSEKKLTVNFYTIQPNLAGIEYVKTKASKCEKYPRIIESVYGGGVVLMQKYNSGDDNRVIKRILKKGDKAIIPSGYAYTIINTRQNSNLIIVEICCEKSNPEQVLDDNNGMAYYVIRKNAKQETVRNPYYKIVNGIEKIDWDNILKDKGITPKTPIIRQILRNYERYSWLFEKNSDIF